MGSNADAVGSLENIIGALRIYWNTKKYKEKTAELAEIAITDLEILCTNKECHKVYDSYNAHSFTTNHIMIYILLELRGEK